MSQIPMRRDLCEEKWSTRGTELVRKCFSNIFFNDVLDEQFIFQLSTRYLQKLRNVGFKFIATSDENSAITKGYQSPIRLPDFRPINDKVVIILGKKKSIEHCGRCNKRDRLNISPNSYEKWVQPHMGFMWNFLHRSLEFPLNV